MEESPSGFQERSDTVVVPIDSESLKPNDTLVVPLNPTAIPGPNYPSKEIVFDHLGQSATFKIGQPIILHMINLDPENTDIVSKFDYSTGEVTLRVETLFDKGEIRLDNHCQIINIGLGDIPKIVPGKGIDKQQIVITPRMDDDCRTIGYEVRAGTIESGCVKGRPNYWRLQNCRKFGIPEVSKIKTKPRPISSKKPKQNDEPKDWFYSIPFD
ncbi:MAG: hypothetical protein HW421_2508 [Ignavibacteria bacterium]|nr:hypothetical protein [Ignavibacteria bacterium]